jgi:hypothetical protein
MLPYLFFRSTDSATDLYYLCVSNLLLWSNSMSLPAAYVGLFESLSETARKHGYALALHGSFNRDFDIVAVPWTDAAIRPSELIKHLHDSITYIKHPDVAMDNFTENTEIHRGRIDGPEKKPHGRLAWNIHLGFGKKLDISVTPRHSTVAERETKRLTQIERDRSIYQNYVYGGMSIDAIAAKCKLGNPRVKEIIEVHQRNRRIRDRKAGMAYVEEHPHSMRAEGGSKGYIVSVPKQPKPHHDLKPLSLKDAQWEADRINEENEANGGLLVAERQ